MTARRGIVILVAALAAPAFYGCAAGREESPMSFQGVLGIEEWRARKTELLAFSLVSGDQSHEDPARWNLSARGWINTPTLLDRFRASVDDKGFSEGQLAFDPLRGVALRFGSDQYLVEIAGVSEGDDGNMVFRDGSVPLGPDFRAVIQEAYGLEDYSVYDE